MATSNRVTSSAIPTIVACVGGAVAVTMLVKRRKPTTPPPPPPSKLQVYGFLPLGPDPDSSPACIKLLTFLKMVKIEYDFVPFSSHEMKGAPKGKAPWVRGSVVGTDGGAPIGDSSLIIDAIVRTDPGRYDLDAHLSGEERAVGTAFKVMLEESCYWFVIHVRWNTGELDRYTTPLYLSGVPSIVRGMVARRFKAKVMRDSVGQGTGLLTESEIIAKCEKEIGAVSEFLGAKKYLLGSRVSSYDATVYGFLVCFMQGDWRHTICGIPRKYQNLVDYVARMRNEFWPELQG